MRLNDITFAYTVSHNQKDLFTLSHKRFTVAMSVNGCDEFFVEYQCNKEEIPNVADVLSAVMFDADCYEQSKDVLDFALEYGYSNADKARAAYNACEDAYMWFQTDWSADDYISAVAELEKLGYM